ncbi:hypothetical protein JTB14_005605 [Gonioctena quinquepunctata]|nr:hypothetical protein JTB14_005605 [Gonioctena quinquepunctata]
MKTYFSQAVETFLRTNPGSTVSQYNMTALLSDAFAKTATISTIANGLKKCGIWPVDRTVFAETDFVAASILLEKKSNNNDVSEHSNQAADNQNQMDVRELKNTENGRKNMSVNKSQLSRSNKHDLNVAIDKMYPLPEQLNNENKRKLSQPAVILSSTPYKENQQTQRKNKAKQVKRIINMPSTSSDAME